MLSDSMAVMIVLTHSWLDYTSIPALKQVTFYTKWEMRNYSVTVQPKLSDW